MRRSIAAVVLFLDVAFGFAPECGAVSGSPACILDPDGSGQAEVARDVVYIARVVSRIPPVPPSFRVSDPTIPSDDVLGARIAATMVALDVDHNGRVEVATDIVYIARRLFGIPPVPPSFRQSDPLIPPDDEIANAVDMLCLVPGDDFTARSGVNLPWRNYGWDVGLDPYGGPHAGFSSTAGRNALRSAFASFATHGVRVVRVFIFADLRSGVLFTSEFNGMPIGFDEYARADFRALVETAEAFGLRIIPVLLDYLVADGQMRDPLGVLLGEQTPILTDPTIRRSFVDILRPLIEEFKDHPTILVWDVMNEPELVIEEVRGSLPDFVGEVRDMIKDVAPNAAVTVGSRGLDDVAKWARFADMQQLHFYEVGRPLPPVEDLELSGPVFIGETPTTDAPAKLLAAFCRGYAGLLFWHEGAAQPYCFPCIAEDYKRWVLLDKTTLVCPPPEELVRLVAPPNGTEDLSVTFEWEILRRRDGVTYCSSIVTDKGDLMPFNPGGIEELFVAGEATERAVELDPGRYTDRSFGWGVVVTACTEPGAVCEASEEPCSGRRLLSDVRVLHIAGPADAP